MAAKQKVVPGSREAIQQAAIKKIMSKIARAQSVKADGNRYPKFYPGRTSTADYVSQFARLCAGAPLTIDAALMSRTDPAPYLTPEQDLVEFDGVTQ